MGCKWVFAIKFNQGGSVARIKACLIAKGYSRIYRIDYSDIFSYSQNDISFFVHFLSSFLALTFIPAKYKECLSAW